MLMLPSRVDANARVLIVEDKAKHADSLEKICRDVGFAAGNIHTEKWINTAHEHIQTFGATLVLLDLALKETPRDPNLGVTELGKWREDFAVIVVSDYTEALPEAAPVYAVIKKPSSEESDRERFVDQLSLAIRSALALSSARERFLSRLQRKLSPSGKSQGTVKGVQFKWKLKFPWFPLELEVPLLSVIGLAIAVVIFLGAIAWVMWVFLAQKK